jgi:hypothetical protein
MEWLRNHPRQCIWILAAAHLLLCVLFRLSVNIIRDLEIQYGYYISFIITLGPSQGFLLAIWVALGGNKTPWRITIALLCVIIYTWFNIDLSHYGTTYHITFVTETFNMSVVLLAARLMGLEIYRPDYSELDKTPKPFQYTIWQIMAWTAVVAVLLSGSYYLPLEYKFNSFIIAFELEYLIFNLFMLGSFILVALETMWLTLGQKWLFLRIALLPVIIVLCSMIYRKNYQYPFTDLCLLLGSEAVWMTVSLVVVRLVGYRLTWQWRFRRY